MIGVRCDCRRRTGTARCRGRSGFSLPDSRPVISRSPVFGNVFFGFGHGHLGLTLSAITAEIVSDLVSGRPLPFDIAAFRPDRF
ncbi:MAG: hypothetical protein CMO26_14160 [Thiotrichales bacterium]|nr:hypothetical protein [Thiotrichales bacterium]